MANTLDTMMNDIFPQPEGEAAPMEPGKFDDKKLVEMFKKWHKESFDQRTIFERQWMRNLWYLLGRQWIYWDSKSGGWQDKRLNKKIPRPVTNIVSKGVDVLRANFARINYGANVRPTGNNTTTVVAASVADDYMPILHDLHNVVDVFNDADFWSLATGNVWVHTCLSYENDGNTTQNPVEECVTCGKQMSSSAIAEAGQVCPECQGTDWQPAVDDQGQLIVDFVPVPKGKTIALSPFEVAFPMIYTKAEDLPYIILMRWRDKNWFEQNPEASIRELAKTLPFGKTPTDRTMQIYKSLPFQNDLGVNPSFMSGGAASSSESEGIVEYDVWVKPCKDFPQGQVIRFVGEQQPVVLHSEVENLPGPLPYTDSNGKPLWTFALYTYKTVGGRIIGKSILDDIISKQDIVNQLDSMMLMSIWRMSNPLWLKLKGSESTKITGEPGTTVFWSWDPVAGVAAKPERIDGVGINPALFQYRELVIKEIEDLMGTYDILAGEKPSGVDAYAAMNFLDERAQSRHTSAFKSRGAAYKCIMKWALEIERQFGEETRTRAVMGPSKGWIFDTFKKADLTSDVDMLIEDGTLAPKTILGERATVEHLNQLGLINKNDPDQVYKIYEMFGQTKLLPAMDAQKQEAWMNMEKFETFFSDQGAQQEALMTGAPPVTYRRWYDPKIHRQELINWCLSDKGRAVLENEAAAQMIDAYLSQIDLALMMTMQGMIDVGGEVMGPAQQGVQDANPQAQPGQPGQPAPEGQPGGAGAAMANSSRNAAGVGPKASGAGGAKEPTGQQQ